MPYIVSLGKYSNEIVHCCKCLLFLIVLLVTLFAEEKKKMSV